MKFLLLILAALLALAPVARADDPEPPRPRPTFIIFRDKGRLHLLTDDLSGEIRIGGEPDYEAGVTNSGETFFREDRTGFEFRRAIPFTTDGDLTRIEFHQNRDGSINAEFFNDLTTLRTKLAFPDLNSAMRNPLVGRALCGAIQDAGQNPQIPDVTRLKFALGWHPTPDRDTWKAMLSLIDRLEDRDDKARRMACVELHRLAVYLPVVLEGVELSTEQAARLQWCVSDMWVDGTPELLMLAQDVFLNQ